MDSYQPRLLVHLIDDRARTTPAREWLSVPRTSDPRDGWRPITYASAANAVNRLAHKLVEVLGRDHMERGTFPTIAYIGPNDARYLVMVLGAVKAGCQALFISPRNSLEGQLSLFDKTDCQVLCFDPGQQRTVQPWLQQRGGMRAVVVDTLEQCFAADPVPAFPYTKTFADAEWDPLMVLHTSGSTGLPKPVVVRQGMMANADRLHALPEWQGTVTIVQAMAERSRKMLCPMPLFHAAGMFISLVLMYYWDQVIALAPSDRPVSMDLVLDCIRHCGCQSVLLPPALLEDISQSPETIEPLTKLDHVVFGGGNLTREAGSRLVDSGVRLVSFISATEFTPYPYYWQTKPALWQYFVFNAEVMGIDWRKVGVDGDDTYEQVIVRKAEQPGLQGIFYTYPDLAEYSTKDLYRPHPTEPNNWIYHGRVDNVIVFSNGEKLNPVTIEEIVADHPRLKGALVVGSERFQPALFLEPFEPPQTEEAAQALIDAVWPLVVKANQETVAHGRIGREFVALADPAKPFARAGKGTIQRAATVKLYRSEIDALYARAAEADAVFAADSAKLDMSSPAALVESIRTLFREQLSTPDLDPDADFFSAGVDSMQVIKASRLLRVGLEAAGAQVDPTALATRAIYGNPTPARLAAHLYSAAQRGAGADKDACRPEIAVMEALLDKFTRDMPAAKPSPADEGQVVVITGTTGGLGSYLLDQAMASPRVRRIVALNRAEDGRARQAHVSAERGLAVDFTKVEFYRADLARPDLGLGQDVYDRLLREVDRVIHNAWPVNFNIPVESFEPHIGGVRNLADFSARAANRVPIVFVSTIGTISHWPDTGPVPEASVRDMSLPGLGYGRSKLVASLVLEKATAGAGVPTAIVRVGQIAGPTAREGYWNPQEWLPSIVASSLHLGVLPADLGAMSTVDWTPIEGIAALLLEVAGVTASVPLDHIDGYFHGVNPRTTRWDVLAPVVQRFYGVARIAKLVPFAEWIARLEASSAATGDDVARSPGVKLLDSYRAFLAAPRHVVFDMTRTMAHSGTMRAMEAVTPALMENWCRQWGY